MARRTFKLTRELPELTKGALLQEKCDDGDQDYTVLDQSFIKYEDEHGRRSVTYARKAVEDEPTWFTEVFKVSPEYMTQDELDQFEVFKVKRTTVKKPKSAAESGKPAKTVILVSKRRRTRGYTLDAFVRIYNSSRNRRSVSAKTGMSVASVYARASQARKAGYPLKAMKRDKEQS